MDCFASLAMTAWREMKDVRNRRSSMLGHPQYLIDRHRKALVLIGIGDVFGAFLDVIIGIAHRERHAARLEHGDVVVHIADGRNSIGRNAEAARHGLYEGALVLAGRGDVEIIIL